jgi:hypothetical protein
MARGNWSVYKPKPRCHLCGHVLKGELMHTSKGTFHAACAKSHGLTPEITIYEDPYTRTRAEGQATIVKDLGYREPGIHRYLVHFAGDAPDQNVERIVVESQGQ